MAASPPPPAVPPEAAAPAASPATPAAVAPAAAAAAAAASPVGSPILPGGPVFPSARLASGGGASGTCVVLESGSGRAPKFVEPGIALPVPAPTAIPFSSVELLVPREPPKLLPTVPV